jgi:hypothetical protein
MPVAHVERVVEQDLIVGSDIERHRDQIAPVGIRER